MVSSGHPQGSEDRLWRLLDERAQPGADTARIDNKLWRLFGEEWAVLISDLAGFTQMAAEHGIIHFLQIIYEHRQLLTPVIERHDGRMLKMEADNLMVLFRDPSLALDAAVEMQQVSHQANQDRAGREILLCIGIGWGRVLRIADDDVWGDEVNHASKLGEDTAGAGEILVTDAVRAALGEKPGEGLELSELDDVQVGLTAGYLVDYPLTE